jgi:glycosyltransferase involved in cell wall biosynthesis
VTGVYEGCLIGVVIPAYNEESLIGDVIDSVPAFVDRLYVVDDCSTDDTWQVIKGRAEAEAVVAPTPDGAAARTDGGHGVSTVLESGPDFETTIVPVRHSINRGRGGAVKTGYQLALVEGLDVVAVMDGDGQMKGEILDRIIDPVVDGEVDYAKGNRLTSLDHCRDMSKHRIFGNIVLTVLNRIASGYWRMRDPQNGYTAINVESFEEIAVGDLYEDYGFLNDLLVRLGAHRKRVMDIPMEAVYDEEESGIRYRSFIPTLSCLLLRMFLWRIWVSYGFGTNERRLTQSPR